MTKKRCGWCLGNSLYQTYHDKEWGVPVRDDRRQFEFLVLESAQAGLSWLTILKKRENYREAYAGFDPEIIARWGEKEIIRLLENPGIIRNRLKIEASLSNARAFLKIVEEKGSFSSWIWSFTQGKPLVNRWKTLEEIPPSSPLSEALAKEMKKRGFRFLGPVILYAHLQAAGLINDHLVDCFRHKEVLLHESPPQSS